MSWNGKNKAVTFSYDDGVEEDKRLVELLNRYGLKATFNLNSGIQTGASFWESNGIVIRRMNIKGLKELYKGHEIAVHTLTHANLEMCSEETIYNEIWQDKCNLERMFDQDIWGMAYPYGVYNEEIMKVVKKCGIQYARTVEATGDFQISEDLLRLKATGHHNDSNMLELARQFVEEKVDTPKLFYVWGHSYEFDLKDNWAYMEELCSILSGHEDIYYGTNAQVLL